MNQLNNRHFHLDPSADELGGGGGAASAGAPASGGAAPASDVPQFDPDSFRSEISGLIQQNFERFGGQFRSELDSRFSKFSPTKGEDDDNNNLPSIEDKKYLNAQGELDAKGFQRYMKDVSRAERAEWEREHQQSQSRLQSESQIRRVTSEHVARETEYEKANPSYRQDILRAGDMQVAPQVGQRILSSKYSANIIHHFAKNRADFMRFQALSYDDPDSAIEMIGELGYQFKSSENSQARSVPAAKPTRGAFGGVGAGNKTHQRDKAEILADWS